MKTARAANALSILLFVLPATVAFAAAPLFPTPLHITRQLHDSISGKTAVLEEYGYGNRLIAVRGARTSIADYEKGELIEIDREAGTYSVTHFDAIARANQIINPPAQGRAAAAAPNADHPLRALGVRATKGGRSAEFFEADVEMKSAKEKVTVALDRNVLVSKNALEALVGAAYPGTHTSEHEVVMAAAAPPPATSRVAAASAEPLYALPVEQVTNVETDGQQIELRSTVMRVGGEAAPADLVAIPPGARLVTSRIVAAANELQQAANPTITKSH